MADLSSHQETHLLPQFLLSRWIPLTISAFAILATLANLVIASNTAPLAERISITVEQVKALEKRLEETKEDQNAWLTRIESKLDKALLEAK